MERRNATVKFIEPAIPPTYVGREGQTLNSWLVGMNDGTQYKFSSIGNFKYPIGSQIEFDVRGSDNHPIKTASKVTSYPPTPKTYGSTMSKFQGNAGSKDDFILLQVCFKECMQAYGKDYEHLVLQKTEEFFDGIKEIYSRK